MRKIILLIIFSIFMLFLSYAEAGMIQCPKTIIVTESTPANDGWSAVRISNEKKLKSSSIFEGSINDIRYLLAPEEVDQDGKLVQTWDLLVNKKRAWIKCDYVGTKVTVSRIIPSSIKQCSRIFRLDKKHNVVGDAVIICQ